MTKPTKRVCAQRNLRSAWASGLRLRWAHTHFVGFVMSRLIYIGSIIIIACFKYLHAADSLDI